MGSAEPGARDVTQQLLTLRVDDALYAVPLREVSELRRWEGAVRVPHAHACVRGVTNVRGEIVPVVEVRQRLGLCAGTYGKTSVVVLLRFGAEGQTRTVGLLVDGVEDVVDLGPDSLRPPPADALPGSVEQELVAGMFTVEQKTGVLLHAGALTRVALPSEPRG